MELSILKHNGVSKEGKEYSCFKLSIGDYNTLIFPRGQLERTYIEKAIGNGIRVDLSK